MKTLLLFFAISALATEHAIVYVHLGPKLPHYQADVIEQARLFNPDCPIYLIAEQSALEELHHPTVTPIACETLRKSGAHEKYLREKETTGFWNYVVERFFYLEEAMQQYELHSIFHMENDVMLYRDLSELTPLCQKHYRGMIGATFDNDARCIPGFVYIDGKEPLSQFVQFVAEHHPHGENDMVLLAKFRAKYHKKWIDHLPIVLPAYAKDYPLETYQGITVQNPPDYWNHWQELAIFDAAAFGQYLGGQDPIHGVNEPGFINESCIFNPARFSLSWEKDALGRYVPLGAFNGQIFRLNNLHIHSKNLKKFSSSQATPPPSALAPLPLEKKRFPLTTAPLDVVLVASKKQRHLLDASIASVRRYVSHIGRIFVISSEPLTSNAEWIDETLFPFSKEAILDQLFGNIVDKRRYTYNPRTQLDKIHTQLLYLYAPLVLPQLSPNILLLDPNTIFVNPVEFLDAEGGALFSVKDKFLTAHRALGVRLLPDFFYNNHAEISHMVLMQTPILEELLQLLREKKGQEPWQLICKAIDPGKYYESCFSAFTLYGSFALGRAAEATLRPLKSATTLQICDLSKYQREGFHFVYQK
ncbi:MAG: hypothetical protein HY069_01555 [Chlamydiia bacterium]|nr:hypothetical protein [Chlamydiia bacterium]